MEIITNSAQETKKLAEKLAKKAKKGYVFALYGDLGSGKTTFTSFFVKALGIENRTQSPTFVIARKYDYVNHIDLYRITNEQELVDFGLKEYLEDSDSITLIEWPELAEAYLPKDTVKIKFEYVDENSRKITIYE